MPNRADTFMCFFKLKSISNTPGAREKENVEDSDQYFAFLNLHILTSYRWGLEYTDSTPPPADE